MDIRFSGKNLSVTEGMKDHLRSKLLRLDRYAPRIIESHVILKKQKYFFEAEITLVAKSLRAYGKGKGEENIYVAIDQAYLRVEKQLKKYREKVKSHHKKGGVRTKEPLVTESETDGLPAEDRPDVIRTKEFLTKPMSVEEASMQLRLSDKPFLVFSNMSSQKVSVIYKREDGHHGLIEPSY